MKVVWMCLAALAVTGCAAGRLNDADRLSLYLAHSGAPVDKIRNYNAMGWDRIDDQHVLLNMRPSESWLLKVSGPCLDWGSASPVLQLSSTGAYVMAKFDRILVAGSPVTCRIEEIRPVDTKAVSAARDAMQAQASSGT